MIDSNSSPRLAPPPEPFALESQPEHYVRSFSVGVLNGWVWRVDGAYAWNVETDTGSEKARGRESTPLLAESEARKAALAVLIREGGK
jgi:hypothetical protein